MGIHPYSVAAFFGELCGYIAFATSLQWWFYHRKGQQPAEWKSQPGSVAHVPDGLGRKWVWALPALDFFRTPQQADGRQPRHARHAVFATVNLVMSASFAGLSAELYHRRLGSLHNVCGPGPAACAWQLFSGVARSLAVQSVLEYYWHVAMHLPYLYAKLHRHHHTYKSPQVFDDLMIHPLEAFGYYVLLFSPSLVVSQHYAGMLIYMSLCGLFGVLDHSGIALRLGPFYDTRAHDVHHRCGFGPAVYKNLAFPFTVMDVLHHTFVEPRDVGYDEQAPWPSQLLNRTGKMPGSDDGRSRRSGKAPSHSIGDMTS